MRQFRLGLTTNVALIAPDILYLLYFISSYTITTTPTMDGDRSGFTQTLNLGNHNASASLFIAPFLGSTQF